MAFSSSKAFGRAMRHPSIVLDRSIQNTLVSPSFYRCAGLHPGLLIGWCGNDGSSLRRASSFRCIQSTGSIAMTKRALVVTAASIFAASTFATTAFAAGVHCGGTNACKGQSACKGANNACKGPNACKGQGFTEAKDQAECAAKGGKVL